MSIYHLSRFDLKLKGIEAHDNQRQHNFFRYLVRCDYWCPCIALHRRIHG